MTNSRILVIKLGALGDFVQALGPMRAIRDHHPKSAITLLTAAPFEELAIASETIDQVWIDKRPRIYQIGEWLAFRKRLRLAGFERVYDLQTSDRSSTYFRLFSPSNRPEWSGIARGCSHPHANPKRDLMHTQERQREQLNMAGIAHVPVSDLSFIKNAAGSFDLTAPYAVLVPGGAPHRPGKRWPAPRYTALAAHFVANGITPVVLGGSSEEGLAQEIAAGVPATRNLTGQTSLCDIAVIAKEASVAVGNDTGPMHIASAAGCPCVVLFSNESDPALCAPRSPKTTIIQRKILSDLRLDDVVAKLPSVSSNPS